MKKWIPPLVKRWYVFDWQFAVHIFDVPLLRTASIVIALMPLAQDVVSLLGLRWHATIPASAWLWWFASVFFLLAWGVMYLACPTFVRHNSDFGDYQKHGHSHRWILWEFWNNIKKIPDWENIILECEEKGLVTDCAAHQALVNSTMFTERMEKAEREAGENMHKIGIAAPVNINRDLYMPIQLGTHRLVLALEEKDPDLPAKEKELFWVLFTKATNANPQARRLCWLLLIAAFALLAANVMKNAAAAWPDLELLLLDLASWVGR